MPFVRMKNNSPFPVLLVKVICLVISFSTFFSNILFLESLTPRHPIPRIYTLTCKSFSISYKYTKIAKYKLLIAIKKWYVMAFFRLEHLLFCTRTIIYWFYLIKNLCDQLCLLSCFWMVDSSWEILHQKM